MNKKYEYNALILFSGMLLFSAMLLFVATNAAPLEIEKLDESGIYLEKIGSTVFFENEWTIGGCVKTPEWSVIMKEIQDYKDILDEACNKTLETYCLTWVHKIDSRLRDARDRVEHITFYENRKRSQKRGLLNVVGQLSKFLFGTMDAEDEEKIKASITNLENQRGESWSFIKKQVTVLSKNFDLLTEPIEAMNKHQSEIDDSLNVIVGKINTLSTLQEKQKWISKIEREVANIMDNIDKVVGSLNKVARIYSTLIMNKLPIELVDTAELMEIYQHLIEENNLNSMFLKKEILFEIAEVKWTQIDKILYYKIKIPIDMTEEMDKSRIISYPVIDAQRKASIHEIMNDILVSSKEKYITTTENKLHLNCKKVQAYELQHIQVCRKFEFEPFLKRDNKKIRIPDRYVSD